MKKAFTLIELLIVVTIIATLMTITFRIGSTSKKESEKSNTIVALQKLENCLSGYNAAFGSYPPVKIYGTRDIYVTTENGVQTDEDGGKELRWDQIEAVCKSQPVDCAFPFGENERDAVIDFSDTLRKMALDDHADWQEKNAHMYKVIVDGFGPGNAGDFTSCWKKDDWREVQIFKFGLLSYLLPRYLVMMRGDRLFYGADGNEACAQWSVNNDKCISVEDGQKEYSWKNVYDYVENGTINRRDYSRVSNLPAQAVCARWIKNFQEICVMSHDSSLFGIQIASSSGLFDASKYEEEGSYPPPLNVYSPGGKGGNWYMLDTITIYDGWGQSFYYYSPTGAQSYTLWSGGENKRTFPPWIDTSHGLLDEYIMEPRGGGSYYKGMKVSKAIADDIIRMRN